ncbi:cytochrome b/b6 domain-containing protein [Celeribacter indicus]|uniref:Cytochrome b561 family protein n=1 Tax=Celeribacter indicus TaxID=1208324 RepID=A0A0B5E7C9_9RHOB|nr:cytochrome b/b6 domain-containing protein [Celeribacter indicus]AJE48182.1 cytochrome b561 family protein [Celeribacter indicus]SDW68791.1 Cytochrome b [Celeribacter indicus]
MSEVLEKTYLWDPVVRVLHWALVIAFATAWGLGKFGPDQMTLHFYAGYTVAAIVVLRILWGFVGTPTARFANFVKGPKGVLAYARTLPSDRPSHSHGHNAVGAIFVVGVLVVLVMQVLSGLFSDPEDYINVGPLAQYVSLETARWALSWHEPLSTLLLVMVLGHIGAIVWYRWRKGENLVWPMVTGYARLPRRKAPDAAAE